MADEHACSWRWQASRIDVAEPTVPVNHVCGLMSGHGGDHVCSCGAVRGE